MINVCLTLFALMFLVTLRQWLAAWDTIVCSSGNVWQCLDTDLVVTEEGVVVLMNLKRQQGVFYSLIGTWTSLLTESSGPKYQQCHG